MMKTLDFNVIESPKLQLVMRDEAKTTVNVVCPTEGLMEELEKVQPRLAAAAQGNAESTRLAYSLAAKLISCNLEERIFTVEELRGPCKWGLESLIIFYTHYIDFINGIAEQKN